MINLHYIYFTDDTVSIGTLMSPDKEIGSKQIHIMIREKTSDKYGCLISDKIDFIAESKKAENVDEYIEQLISNINLKGDSNNE